MPQLQRLLCYLRSLSFAQWVVVTALVIGTFLRFWKLPTAALFLGDQGRDSIIASRIFTDNDLVLIGPTTSVGNMYLGPLYYYFMLPFIFLSYPSPLGPIYVIALLGSLTIFFMYYLGRQIIGEKAATIAAVLCAFSAVAIELSRFSWNPNPIPLVSLFLIFCTFKAVTKNPKYWIWVGMLFAVLLQLHYVTLLAGAAAGLLWLWQVAHSLKQPTKKRNAVLLYGVLAALVVLLSLAPLVAFDARHGWLNAQSLGKILTSDDTFEQTTKKTSSILTTLRETHGRSMHILFEFLIGQNRTLNTVLVCIVASILIFSLLKKKAGKYHAGLAILTTYLVIGILGLSMYKNTVFNHYILYLFPVTFLILGYCLAKISELKKIGIVVVLVCLVFFGWYNIPRYSFVSNGTSFAVLEEVSASIQDRVEPGEKYGILLISGTRDFQAMNYRYFLSFNKEKRPVDVSEHSTADILFIIDEEKKNPNPEFIDLYERTTFPGSLVTERYAIKDGPNITVIRKSLLEDKKL